MILFLQKLVLTLILSWGFSTPVVASQVVVQVHANESTTLAQDDVPVVPKVFITGPPTAQVNSWIWLDVKGSVSKSPVRVVTLRGPIKIDPQLLYDKPDPKAILVGAILKAEQPGVYEFLAIANGDAVPDVYAVWPVTVGGSPLPPTPVPPGPGPLPVPVPPVPPVPPPVVPVPQSIKLVAVAVYSGDTTSLPEREFVEVRDSLTLMEALATLNVDFFVMDRADARLLPKSAENPTGCGIGKFLAPTGPNPQMLIYDTGNTSNSIYDGDGVKMAKQASFDSPRKEADIIAMFKKIRGVK